jgi:hypothetical protein
MAGRRKRSIDIHSNELTDEYPHGLAQERPHAVTKDAVLSTDFDSGVDALATKLSR